MTLRIKKKDELIKNYVIDSLIESYHIDHLTARRMVDRSVFAKLLRDDPKYVQHYDVEYWAKRVKDESTGNKNLVLL